MRKQYLDSNLVLGESYPHAVMPTLTYDYDIPVVPIHTLGIEDHTTLVPGSLVVLDERDFENGIANDYHYRSLCWLLVEGVSEPIGVPVICMACSNPQTIQ